MIGRDALKMEFISSNGSLVIRLTHFGLKLRASINIIQIIENKGSLHNTCFKYFDVFN